MHFCNKDVIITTVFHTYVLTVPVLPHVGENVALHLIKGKEGSSE